MSTQFGERYRRWARITKATMRIQHKPGDAMQVDWAGDTIPIQDPVTGEQSAAYLFVAVLPCSYYTYAEACDDMKTEMHMPPQKCSLTADDGASPPPEWCTASAEMVHGGRECGAPGRHAGNYSGMPLRFRMDSPSIWMV